MRGKAARRPSVRNEAGIPLIRAAPPPTLSPGGEKEYQPLICPKSATRPITART